MAWQSGNDAVNQVKGDILKPVTSFFNFGNKPQGNQPRVGTLGYEFGQENRKHQMRADNAQGQAQELRQKGDVAGAQRLEQQAQGYRQQAEDYANVANNPNLRHQKGDGYVASDRRLTPEQERARSERIQKAKIDVTGKTLLVGEADFSLARSVAEQTSGDKKQLIHATSYESLDRSPHSSAQANLEQLKQMGVSVKGGVDARDLKGTLGEGDFHTIAWNFPHTKAPRPQSAKVHRELLNDFFGSAQGVMKKDGQIRVTMVDSPTYKGWRIGEQASAHGFEITESHKLPYSEIKEAYPGYGHQQTGSNDSAFKDPERPTVTYVFRMKKE